MVLKDSLSSGRFPPRLQNGREEMANSDQLTCDICGSRMIQRQCKILCTNCGYTRDCSDP